MKRLVWADVIRVLAIFFIVFIHSISPVTPKIAMLFYLALTRSGIGLFVMLSGALLLSKKQNYLTFYKKRFVKIVVPWILWTFIYIAFYKVVQNQKLSLRYFYQVFFGDFWFLQMIVGLYLLTPLLWKFIQSAKMVTLGVVISVCFIFVSIFPTLNHLYGFLIERVGILPLQYLGYFLLGYWVVMQRFGKKSIIFWTGTFIVGIISTITLSWNSNSNGFFFEYLSPTISLVTISGFILLYAFLKNEKKVHPAVPALSKASFGIFFIHPFILFFLFQKEHFLETWYLMPFKVAIIFFISFGAVRIVQSIPVVKRIIP